MFVERFERRLSSSPDPAHSTVHSMIKCACSLQRRPFRCGGLCGLFVAGFLVELPLIADVRGCSSDISLLHIHSIG